MNKKSSKRSKTKPSPKLKETVKKLSGGNVREFEELYEESPEKGAPRRKQRDAPAQRGS